jgi:hypothetical protein
MPELRPSSKLREATSRRRDLARHSGRPRRRPERASGVEFVFNDENEYESDGYEGRLSDTPDHEAFGFKRCPDFGNLVPLDFDGPVLHRTAGAARRPQFLCHLLDL